MRGFLRFLVAAPLIVAACTYGEDASECFGIKCPNTGAIDVEVLVKSCDVDGCEPPTPLREGGLYIHMVELSGPKEERCGPGDCGAQPDAFSGTGWPVGRWKMIAPKVKGLVRPHPQIVEVSETETEHVQLVYVRRPTATSSPADG